MLVAMGDSNDSSYSIAVYIAIVVAVAPLIVVANAVTMVETSSYWIALGMGAVVGVPVTLLVSRRWKNALEMPKFIPVVFAPTLWAACSLLLANHYLDDSPETQHRGQLVAIASCYKNARCLYARGSRDLPRKVKLGGGMTDARFNWKALRGDPVVIVTREGRFGWRTVARVTTPRRAED